MEVEFLLRFHGCCILGIPIFSVNFFQRKTFSPPRANHLVKSVEQRSKPWLVDD
jgi:hypothetical protein